MSDQKAFHHERRLTKPLNMATHIQMHHTSSGIFTLTSQFGLDPDCLQPLDDAEFDSFVTKYSAWSKVRDNELLHYLKSNPTLFRAYVPYSRRVYSVAAQVFWYLDQLIVRDPIEALLKNMNRTKIEQHKYDLREIVALLNRFKEAIYDGYVLLAGESIFDPGLDAPSRELTNTIANVPDVNASLRNAAYLGYASRPDSNGNPTHVYQIVLDSGGIFAFKIEAVGQGKFSSPSVRIGEYLPQISHDDLFRTLGSDPFRGLEEVFEREVRRTILSLMRARSLNSAVIFDREVDGLIISESGQLVDDQKQYATSTVLNLLLPYIDGIPSTRLQELRNEQPAVFADFRGRLYEMVDACIRGGIIRPEEMRAKVDREITPHLIHLDSEMKSTLKKLEVQGLGATVITASAVLLGAFLNIPETVLFGTGLSGAAAALKTLSDSIESSEKQRGHPFYFLWKAKRGIRY